jgi:beta-N-acetylhexosaminidase
MAREGLRRLWAALRGWEGDVRLRRLWAVLRGREGDVFQRRRLLALLGGALVLLAGGAVAVVVATSDEGDPFPTIEAGSRFGGGEQGSAQEEEEAGEEDARPDLSDEQIRRLAAGLFLVGFSGQDSTAPFFERLQAREWGAVLIDETNYVDEEQVTTLIQQVRDVARLREGRRPLVIVPQEGGDQSAFDDLPPGGQASLGRESLEAVRRGARSAARALARVGVDAVLAPDASVAVTGGAAEGRGFADDPARVVRAVRASVTGWQEGGVTPIVNSFPGEGAASQNPDLGPATVGLDLQSLRDNAIRAFNAVSRDVRGIQMSAALYSALDPVTPATLVPEAVALLRGDLDFDGAVVSANLLTTTAAGGGSVGDDAVDALQAGCDLLYLPGGQAEQEEAYRAVVTAIREGDLDVERLQASVKRIGELRRRPAAGNNPGMGGGVAPQQPVAPPAPVAPQAPAPAPAPVPPG